MLLEWSMYLMNDGVLTLMTMMGIYYLIKVISMQAMNTAFKSRSVKRFKIRCEMTIKERLSWLLNLNLNLSEIHRKNIYKTTKVYKIRRGCKRYYIRGTKKSVSRIANKTFKPNIDKINKVVAFPTVLPRRRKIVDFDTDSYLIGVDCHASRCISNDIQHL